MQLYRPTPAEQDAALALLRSRFPAEADAARIGRGIDLVPAIGYETVAERAAFWLARGLPGIQTGSADPGWYIPASPDDRRNASDPTDSTPRLYYVGDSRCQCWASLTTEQPCRHVWAVRAYRAIVNAKLDALAQAGAVDMRPAGRYDGLYDMCDCWGRTIAACVYSPRTDRWHCETDQDVAAFANWLTRDEAMSEIQRPRARGGYENV